MKFEETIQDGVLVLVVLEPRLDARTGADLKGILADLVRREQRRLVLDLRQVSFIDSTGLGAIVSGLKLVGTGGEIALAGLGESVATLFKLTRMDKVFRAFSSVADAVNALRKP